MNERVALIATDARLLIHTTTVPGPSPAARLAALIRR
jgi:hypothetical protein